MSTPFVHLHVHSEYSLANGLIRIKSGIKKIAKLGMPAVAITDQSNLFAMVKFYRAAVSNGIKPIIGADMWLTNDIKEQHPSRVVLLCKDNQGYHNLSRLVTKSYLEGQTRGIPTLKKEWLFEAHEGLIVLSGGRSGDIGQAILANKTGVAQNILKEWKAVFDDRFYIELQRTERNGEEYYNVEAVAMASQYNVPVVATNDVHFLKQEDYGAHEARVCISDGRILEDPRRPRLYSEQQYMKSTQQMYQLFEDLPEALENTYEIAKRCNVELALGKNFLPDFPTPNGISISEFFKQQSEEGLHHRLAEVHEPVDLQIYQERLALELNVINQMGFAGYFLIVADFIRWAKSKGIPVGPGRGSGAGSIVAYALNITDLDPIKFELLFERFLNPERVSMPDFDIDFCMERRDRVIEYVADRYGREKVSQIITYGTMTAKAVIRDAGRVLGYTYGFVDQVAKLIPFDIGITLEKAMDQEESLRKRYDEEDEVRELIDLARSLEGITRNAGKHAGGVVIAPTDLTDFTPLYCEQGNSSSVVTQLDKNDVEAVGLVKFDFLGLRTLTIIDWAVNTINDLGVEQDDSKLDITKLPLDDEATFRLLKNCATTAVFQLESRGMKDLIKRLQPDCFEEIIALVALFRPGPLQSGMVDDFINRKHGRAKVTYSHPDLEPILKPTYGIILYQEQVMQIAQVLANYTLGAADLLRRAMGKKKPEEMAKQREIFLDGCLNRGIEHDIATYIFDLMEKFAGYGFNKSHSAAYALVSYQTAWLKTHFPAAFMAAVLSADMDNTDKVVTLIDECGVMKLEIVPPSVNSSDFRFTIKDNNSIYYGLGAIKGIGQNVIENIVKERENNGLFNSLFEFCRRLSQVKTNRRMFDAFVRAGALDCFGKNRSTLSATLDRALSVAERQTQNAILGQDDLFASTNDGSLESIEYNEVGEWGDKERLIGEKETLGLYLTGHPIDRYLDELARFTSARIVDLSPNQNKTVVVAGLIAAMRSLKTKRGERMAFITLDDRSGRIEIAVFSETFQKYRNILVKDKLCVVHGEVALDDYSGLYKMNAKDIYDIDNAREKFAKQLSIRICPKSLDHTFVHRLENLLKPYREGNCPVSVQYFSDWASVICRLGETWRIKPTDELLNRLRELVGERQVELIY